MEDKNAKIDSIQTELDQKEKEIREMVKSSGKEPIVREKIVEKIVYRDREVEKSNKLDTPPERLSGTGVDTKKKMADFER